MTTSGRASETRLLERIASGDREAFDRLVESYRDAVFRVVRAATSRAADADDAWQETFLSVWRHAAGFRGEASAKSWVLAIARNAAFKKRARGPEEPIDDESLLELGQAAGWGSESPETLAIRAERREILDAALARLASADREILVLRDVEGLSGEETATALGLGLRAMKSRLHRARLRLAATVREECDEG